MKEEKLTNIAREYARESIDPRDFSNGTYQEMVEEMTETTYSVLTWLSDRFELIDKDLIKRMIALHIEETSNRKEGTAVWFFHKGIADTLKYLFPEIVKEVDE